MRWYGVVPRHARTLCVCVCVCVCVQAGSPPNIPGGATLVFDVELVSVKVAGGGGGVSSSGAAGHSYSAMNSGGWLQPSPPPAATALPNLFRKRSQVGSPSLPLCPLLPLCVCVSLSLCASGWRAAAVRGCCGLSVCAANQCGESPRRRDLSALVCRNGRLQCAPLRAAQVLAETGGEVRGVVRPKGVAV